MSILILEDFIENSFLKNATRDEFELHGVYKYPI